MSGREVELYLSGTLDDLPPTVGHAILGAWYDDEGRGVVVTGGTSSHGTA